MAVLSLQQVELIVKTMADTAIKNEAHFSELDGVMGDAAVHLRETTKSWTAKRGRQSFTGDRSIGTYDSGIVAVGDMTVEIVKALSS
jgi:hypothetical protein